LLAKGLLFQSKICIIPLKLTNIFNERRIIMDKTKASKTEGVKIKKKPGRQPMTAVLQTKVKPQNEKILKGVKRV